ncbi:hypothetical protein V7S43_005277 [Phytophthora oleae]|uniref:Uncharacterized protein n=1 Tax=Phytophthora oleae TaxID=2107226 RepID=A0ABD3FSP4_9STRA
MNQEAAVSRNLHHSDYKAKMSSGRLPSVILKPADSLSFRLQPQTAHQVWPTTRNFADASGSPVELQVQLHLHYLAHVQVQPQVHCYHFLPAPSPSPSTSPLSLAPSSPASSASLSMVTDTTSDAFAYVCDTSPSATATSEISARHFLRTLADCHCRPTVSKRPDSHTLSDQCDARDTQRLLPRPCV